MVNELNFPLHHENEPPRFDASIDERTPREFSRNLNAVLCAIFMLSFFSFSPPEDFTSEGLGTSAILHPTVIKYSKLLARGVSGILLLITLFQLSHRLNIVSKLSGFGALAVFLLWSVFSCSWSALPSISINQVGSFGILALLGVTIRAIWRSMDDTSKILFAVANCFLVISIGLISLRLITPQYGALTRASSGLLHSTNASAMASLAIMVTSLSFFLWNWKWSQLHFFLACPIHFLAILLSGNRLSLLLVLILFSLSFLLFARKEWLGISLAIIGSIGAVCLAIDPGNFALKETLKTAGVAVTQGQTKRQLKSISGRDEMWKTINIQFKKSPIRGHGYFVTSENGQVYVWGQWGNWTAHNAFLQLLATTGIVGALLFGAFILQLLLKTLRLFSTRDPDCLKLAGFTTIIGLWYLGWGLLNSSIFGPTQPESVFFFVVCGLIVAMPNRAGEVVD